MTGIVHMKTVALLTAQPCTQKDQRKYVKNKVMKTSHVNHTQAINTKKKQVRKG